MKRFLSVLISAIWAASAAAIPITGEHIVRVDGTQWVQPDLFTDLSWIDVNTVCPSGVCIDGGELNGYTMTGWAWASVDDVNALFNAYLIAGGVSEAHLLGPGPGTTSSSNDVWATAFTADFRTTWTVPGVGEDVRGFTRDTRAPSHGVVYRADVVNFFGEGSVVFGSDYASTSAVNNLISSSYENVGVWFYAAHHSPTVSTPSTLALFGAAIACVGWARRKTARTKIERQH